MPSRTKIENAFMLCANVINIGLFLMVIAAAIFKSLNADFSYIMLAIYTSALSFALVVNECRHTEVSLRFFGFLWRNLGRGILFIFFGCVVLSTDTFNIISGTLLLFTGTLYIILHFLPSVPHPNPIAANWENWKDYSAEGLDLPRPKNSTLQSNIEMRLKNNGYPPSQVQTTQPFSFFG